MALLCEAVGGSDGVDTADAALGDSCCCRRCFCITEGGRASIRRRLRAQVMMGGEGRTVALSSTI